MDGMHDKLHTCFHHQVIQHFNFIAMQMCVQRDNKHSSMQTHMVKICILCNTGRMNLQVRTLYAVNIVIAPSCDSLCGHGFNSHHMSPITSTQYIMLDNSVIHNSCDDSCLLILINKLKYNQSVFLTQSKSQDSGTAVQ